MTVQFPPKCAQWCTTYKHLKRLFFTPLELCRLCHKCIAWNQQQPQRPRHTGSQPRLLPKH